MMNNETISSVKEIKCVILNDKTEICLIDHYDISISFISEGKTISNLPIDYPSADYGGGSLYLSPTGSYLLFAYYSRLSQEAFILFKISDCNLLAVYEWPYSWGEAANYIFSQDEKLLIQSLPKDRTLWNWKWYVEQGCYQLDKDGVLFFVFGYINILDIENMVMSQHEIRIYPSEAAENFSERSWNPFIPLKLTDPNTLKISMPWGDETLVLPLMETLVFGI